MDSAAFPFRTYLSRMKRTLALDIGEKRIGIAIESEDGSIACGLTVLARGGENETIAAIRRIVDAEGVGTIVIGHPLRLNDTRGPAAKRVEALAAVLEEKLPCTIILWDERLSTAEAERLLLQADASRRRRRAVRDRLAAQLILQSYLDARTASLDKSS